MIRTHRPSKAILVVALATALAVACSAKEEGVIQAQKNEAAISLSEGACLGTCPVYDMTLHPDGAYILNGVRFVKTTGVTEGKDADAWAAAEKVLTEASFWTLKPEQTLETMPNCHTDAPTAKITWRTAEGKEKTVTYNAGCGVEEMQKLVAGLRTTLHFDDLVYTTARFAPDGSR